MRELKEIIYESSYLPPLKHCLIRACVTGQDPLSATNQSTQCIPQVLVLEYKLQIVAIRRTKET